MTINTFEPCTLSNEYDITEILAHFDADYILNVLEDKLNNIDFSSSLQEPNFVASFEENFKYMNEQFPGDSQNIRSTREEVYIVIINMLTERFQLEFNTVDPNIDLYTAAYYLYDFLVCNRNNLMVKFFTSFIINNKDSLYQMMNMDDYRKTKDISTSYNKKMYEDPKYAVIAANMSKIVNYIGTLDITMLNIFQTVYTDYKLVEFMDNAFRDKNNFFRNYYCTALQDPMIAPVIISNICMGLQKTVGSMYANNVYNYIVGDQQSSGGGSSAVNA